MSGEHKEDSTDISFLKQTNDLYVYRMGDYVVNVKFQKEGPTIDEKMEEYLRHLAEAYM